MERWHKRGRGPGSRAWRPPAAATSRAARVALGLALAWLLLCVVMATRRRSGAPAAADIDAIFRGEVASASAQRRQAAKDGSAAGAEAAGVPWLAGVEGADGAAHVVSRRADVMVASSGHVSERVAADGGASGVWLAQDDAVAAFPTRALPSTLVAFVYNPREEAHVANWDFFRRVAITRAAGVQYRVLLPGPSSGVAVPAAGDRPPLPADANASYVETGAACGGVWGVLGAALDGAPEFAALWRDADAIVVSDASVRGPFIPAYLQHSGLHWTAAFTSRLRGGQGDPWMTGSAISCEGAPRDGNASGSWRRHPYLLPYAWAVDRRGASALQRDPDVLRCHANAWSERYHGDSGAALAVMSRGGGLDTLLARFQGIDWQDNANWHCNGGVRPDVDLSYDGTSVSPFEAVFVPFDAAKLGLRWTHVTSAERYSRWLLSRLDAESDDAATRQAAAAALASNDWVDRSAQIRAERMVYMNARGPGCFDLHYYIQNNPDLTGMEDPLEIWEHWVLLGQFQGRPHRFNCPVQLSASYRIAYLRARGDACFDHEFYLRHSPDLRGAQFKSTAEIFGHYAFYGQFEGRLTRFTCPDTMWDFASGFDSVEPTAPEEPKTAATAEHDGTSQAKP